MDNQSWIFISHASEDKDLVNSLCERIEKNGLHCWIAPRNIRIGANYAHGIMEGISNSALMIVLVSEHSNKSNHVLNEVQRAAHRDIGIIPIRLDNSPLSPGMELFLSSRQWLDLRHKKLSEAQVELIDTCKHYLSQTRPLSEQIHVNQPQNLNKKTAIPYKKMALMTVSFLGLLLLLWFGRNFLTSSEDQKFNLVSTERNGNEIPVGRDANHSTSAQSNIKEVQQQIMPKQDGDNLTIPSDVETKKRKTDEFPKETNSKAGTLKVGKEESSGENKIKMIEEPSENPALVGKFENYVTREYLEFIPSGKNTFYSGKLRGYQVSGSVTKAGSNSYKLSGDATGQFYILGKNLHGNAKTKQSGNNDMREIELINYQ